MSNRSLIEATLSVVGATIWHLFSNPKAPLFFSTNCLKCDYISQIGAPDPMCQSTISLTSVRKRPFRRQSIIASLFISGVTLLAVLRTRYSNSDKSVSAYINPLPPRRKAPGSNLIIIAHARTGSSWLGKLFDSNPEVFYIYEPLYVLQRTTLENSGLYNQAAVELLQDIFRCNFSAQDEFVRFLSSLPHQRFSSKSLFNQFCFISQRVVRVSPRKYLCEELTAHNVSRVCNSHAHVVVKTLSHRFPLKMKTLQILFNKIENINIIHLVRDPRAVIDSFRRVGWISGYNRHSTDAHSSSDNISSSFKSNIKRFCSSMIKELYFIVQAEEKFPKRYRMTTYEKLVHDPLHESQKLYEFAGIPFSYKTRDWIALGASQHFRSRSNSPYSLFRPNANRLIDFWRTQLGKNKTKFLEKQCLPVLNLLGYRRVFSDD